MIDNVSAAYNFVNETYEKKDKLFFFGFSRGAYAIRLLASVIHQIGLLPRGHRHLIPYAINLAFSGRTEDAAAFSEKLELHKPKVNFLGLFDCVKSSVFGVDDGWRPFRLSVPFSWYNDDVLCVRHAMSIDERRLFFPVNRWADDCTRPGTESNGRTVRQVWFAGDHSDVGGGHVADGLDLSVSALVWMITEAKSAGLSVASTPPEVVSLANDYKQLANLRCNDLAKVRWPISEIFPAYSANDDDDDANLRSTSWRGRFIPYVGRKVFVHASVKQRLQSGVAADGGPYRPVFLEQAKGSVVWID